MLSVVTAAGVLDYRAFPGEPNDLTITPGVFTHINDSANISLLSPTCPAAEFLRGLSIGVEVSFIAGGSVSWPTIPFDLPDSGVVCLTGQGIASLFTSALQTSAATGAASVVAGAELPENGDLYLKVTADGDEPVTDYKLYHVVADPGQTHPDSAGGDLEADGSVFRAASPSTGRVITGNVSGTERDRYAFNATPGKRYVVMLDQNPERTDNQHPDKDTITSTRLKAFKLSDLITPLAQNISVGIGNAIGPLTVSSNDKIIIDVENSGAGAGTSYRFVVAEFDDADFVTQLEGPQTFSAAPALAIPDNATAVTSTLNASGLSGTITDVDVTLNISHTYDADLDVFLISPSGTRIELFTDVGGDGDNFSNTTLDDAFSFNSITQGSAPFSSTFSPEGLLSALNGQDANGDWKLEVTDDLGVDTGTLINWSIKLTTSGNTDTKASATGLAAGKFGRGAIDPARDIDYWKRSGINKDHLVFSYVDTSNSGNKDSRLELSVNDSLVAFDQADDGGPPGVTEDAIKELRKTFDRAGLQAAGPFASVFVELGDRDDRANLRALSVATEVRGGPGLDFIVGGLVSDLIDGGPNADVIEGVAGDDVLKGGLGDDTFIVDTEYGAVQTDTVYGGDDNTAAADSGYDTIFVPSSAQKNEISVSLDSSAAADAVRATIDVSGVTTRFKLPKNDIDEIQISGGDGADVLKFKDVGVSDDEIVVYIRGPHQGSGAIYVYNSSGTTEPTVTFDGIEQVDFLDGALTRADGSRRLAVFSDDSFEQGANDTIDLATHLGAGGAVNLDPAVYPAGEIDVYQFVAQHTGTLDFRVLFEENGALPGSGDLDIEIRDANGNLIASGTSSDDDERIVVSAVEDQVYFLRVFGATGPAINDYDITVINTPAPVPTSVVLDATDDTGASDLDQVTFKTQLLHFLVNADLNQFANEGITILTPAQAAAGVTTGAAVEVFNEGVSIGFAAAVAGSNNTIFEITLDANLSKFPVRGANAAGALGYDGFLNFITASVTMFDGLRDASSDPTPAVGRSLFSQSLVVTADNVAPLAPNLPDLLPSSDSGQFNNDNVTLFNALALQGIGEANSRVVIHANGLVVGQGIVGTDATDGVIGNGLGVWEITTEPLTPASISYVITAQLEDLAGNIGPKSPDLHVLIDPSGPQVTNVFITGRGPSDPAPYNLFGQKPGNAMQGPTPAVRSLTIRLHDLPNRETAFFPNYLALNPTVSAAPGNFILTGDANGIIPIQGIILTNDPTANGQPATATIQLQFSSPLPDDRYTLTIKDSVVDPAGNGLDGESNAGQPSATPSFPSGNGLPGNDFSARFTVDSRAELGAWASGSVYIDTNGNERFDPTNPDFTNRDISYLMGFSSDNLFAGNFVASAGASADGFDKLAAYGLVGNNYRWLLDANNDGVVDLNIVQPLVTGFTNMNGTPVAGNFDGNAANGDEVAVKIGNSWAIDTNHDFKVDRKLAGTNMVGLPIVGDFDGDGKDDLGAWADNKFHLNLSTLGPIDGSSDRIFDFGFASVRERPVAGDFDADGITDLGLWVPDRAGAAPAESAEWYLLISGGQTITARLAAGAGAITFKPTPFGNDRYAQFGDEFGLPVVGNFDPPVTPTLTYGSFTNERDLRDVNNDGFVSAVDALLVIDHLNLANGDSSLTAPPYLRAPYVDVDGDGHCTPADALIVIDWLNLQLGDTNQEAEGESADAYFHELGSSSNAGLDFWAALMFLDSIPKKKPCPSPFFPF